MSRGRGVRRGYVVVASFCSSYEFWASPSPATHCFWMCMTIHTVTARTTNPNFLLSLFFFGPDVLGVSSPARLILPYPMGPLLDGGLACFLPHPFF